MEILLLPEVFAASPVMILANTPISLHRSIAPSLPAVVEGLVRTVFSGRIAPAQAVAADEDNPAQAPPVIDTRHPMALGEIRSMPRHLSFAQPV